MAHGSKWLQVLIYIFYNKSSIYCMSLFMSGPPCKTNEQNESGQVSFYSSIAKTQQLMQSQLMHKDLIAMIKTSHCKHITSVLKCQSALK